MSRAPYPGQTASRAEAPALSSTQPRSRVPPARCTTFNLAAGEAPATRADGMRGWCTPRAASLAVYPRRGTMGLATN